MIQEDLNKDILEIESDNNNNLVILKLPFNITLDRFKKFQSFEYNSILGVGVVYVDENTIKVSHSKYFNICKLLPLIGFDNNHIKNIIDLNQDLVIESYKQLLYIIGDMSFGHSANGFAICRELGSHVLNNHLGIVGFNHTIINFGGGIIRRPDFYFISNNTLNQMQQPLQSHRPFHAPHIPEFIMEIRSPSQSNVQCRNKMIEYILNGIETCLLIDEFDGCFSHFCATPNPGNPPLIPNSIPILGPNHQPIGVNESRYMDQFSNECWFFSTSSNCFGRFVE